MNFVSDFVIQEACNVSIKPKESSESKLLFKSGSLFRVDLLVTFDH